MCLLCDNKLVNLQKIKRFVDKCYIHLSFLQSSLYEWSSKINFVVRMCVCTYKL